jgi:ribosomal protein S18 acetylase RimI-like enzyme
MVGASHLARTVFIGIFAMQDHLFIRDYLAEDFDAVTILWRIAREKSMPDFQREKGHFFYEDREYFQNHILRKNRVWVVVANGQVSAFMAMDGDFIDQLYVHPDRQRRGIGKALLDFARERSPGHLWLYTLQVNTGARDFYEKNGFVAEKFGVSPPPENEPDIEYHWRS